MDDLKTLKNLIRNFPDETIPGFVIAEPKDLRQAAREWVVLIKDALRNNKAISQKPFWIKDKEVIGDQWKAHYYSIVIWIEHFFNLKD